MGTALLSVQAPHHIPLSQFPYNTNTKTWLHGSTTLKTYPSSKSVISLCSASSAPVVEGPASPPPDDSLVVQSESATDKLPLSACKVCGKEEVERGCNGEGRIQGGIATIPGFGWWPIKAYRPCPGFLASGGRYKRQGQSMDEVAFGRGGRRASTKISTEVQSSKEKQGPRRLKS